MTRPTRETRRRILESAYGLFYREGFQRVGVDAVAAAAGVTKRTLYNHFSSKNALIAVVLEAQADLAEAEVRRWCGDAIEARRPPSATARTGMPTTLARSGGKGAWSALTVDYGTASRSSLTR